MPNYERNLTQTATYWEPDSEDKFGKKTFKDPVYICCRWEDRAEMVFDKTGQQVVTKSRVFFKQDISLDGYICLGEETTDDPTLLSNAYEVRQVARVPDLRNLTTLYTVYL